MSQQLNIIMAGKSGVGKSSFLNYLIDNDLLATGAGLPVTQEYFEEVEYCSPKNGVKFLLYDTKGIEPTTCVEYENVLLKKIEQCDSSNDIFKWIHTVYYCFAPPRIENFEIEFIKKLLKKVSVTVLITKCDLIGNDIFLKLKQQIISDLGLEVQVIPVCSVQLVTRKGKSERFGREEVLKSSFLGLWNKLANCEPARCTKSFTEPLAGGADLDYLCNFPETMSEGGLDTLKKLSSCQKEFNPKEIWRSSKEICANVFEFYAKVNGFRPRNMLNVETEKFLVEIKNFDFTPYINKVKESYDEMMVAFSEWNKSVVFESREQKRYLEKRKAYSQCVKNAAKEFVQVLGNFTKHYRAQLLQYGQDCLRADGFVENRLDSSAKIDDLSANQKVFFNMLVHQDNAPNNFDDYKQFIFNMLAQELDIQENDVEIIEQLKEHIC